MDEQSLKRNYRKACEILGFDVEGYEERLKAYRYLDDYRITFLDPIKGNKELRYAFSEAHRIYHFEPEEYKRIFEES